MRTIEINLYQYSELSEEAKQKALENWAGGDEYFWGDDALNSLHKGLDHFGCELSNWSIDFLEPHRNSYKLSVPNYEDDDNTLDSLIKEMGSYNPETLKGNGDCKFTGCCMDEDFADGIRESYFAGERDLRELMLAGISTWEIAVRKDAEYQYTEEFYADHCESNEYEFTEDGEMY